MPFLHTRYHPDGSRTNAFILIHTFSRFTGRVAIIVDKIRFHVRKTILATIVAGQLGRL